MNAEMKPKLKLQIDSNFRQFIDDEVLPLTTVDSQKFWFGVQSLLTDLMPINQTLLNKREEFF